MTHAVAASLGWGADRLLGEPPARIHPVALFGTAMVRLEHSIHAPRRRRGVLYAAAGTSAGVGAGLATRKLLGALGATAVISAVCMAGKMLDAESRAVATLLAGGQLDAARNRVGGLVGRRTDELTELDICRAAIESLAENTVDAVTATMFWATVGGATGAAAHRCINTMDAMVGHRNERFEHFGWASARLDDVANWVPARLTALAVLIVTPTRAGEIIRTVRRDAPQHPSPNGGVVEAAFAAALDIRLGGTNTYDGISDDRGELGDGQPPTVADIERTVWLARRVAVVSLMINAVGSLAVRRLLRQLAR